MAILVSRVLQVDPAKMLVELFTEIQYRFVCSLVIFLMTSAMPLNKFKIHGLLIELM